MRITVLKEIKVHEYRVALTPAGAYELTAAGHQVWVETQAGSGVGYSDADYRDAGARISADIAALYDQAELILKVKEPQATECARFKPGQTVFTFLHLAADPLQAQALLNSGVTAIAYETVTAAEGSLPLLTPMSEVAGRMSIQVGAACLQKTAGGRGVLLGGVPGVAPAKVVILGGGVAGTHAVTMAVGLGADVTVVDRSVKRLRELSALFGARIKTAYSTTTAIAQLAATADLVIGAVLVPGAAAPKLITHAMLQDMQPGAVLVDIAIDQGGCFASSRPTTHEQPTYVQEGIVHYCVTNIPGAVPRTSTLALTNATLPFIKALADHGIQKALALDPHLLQGVNIHAGHVCHPAVAQALNLPYEPF